MKLARWMLFVLTVILLDSFTFASVARLQKSAGTKVSSSSAALLAPAELPLEGENASTVIDSVLADVVHNSMHDLVEKLSSSLKRILGLFERRPGPARGASFSHASDALETELALLVDEIAGRGRPTAKPERSLPASNGDQSPPFTPGPGQKWAAYDKDSAATSGKDRATTVSWSARQGRVGTPPVRPQRPSLKRQSTLEEGGSKLVNVSTGELERWIQKALINVMWRGASLGGATDVLDAGDFNLDVPAATTASASVAEQESGPRVAAASIDAADGESEQEFQIVQPEEALRSDNDTADYNNELTQSSPGVSQSPTEAGSDTSAPQTRTDDSSAPAAVAPSISTHSTANDNSSSTYSDVSSQDGLKATDTSSSSRPTYDSSEAPPTTSARLSETSAGVRLVTGDPDQPLITQPHDTGRPAAYKRFFASGDRPVPPSSTASSGGSKLDEDGWNDGSGRRSPVLVQTVLVSAAAALAVLMVAFVGVFLAFYRRKRNGVRRRRWGHRPAFLKQVAELSTSQLVLGPGPATCRRFSTAATVPNPTTTVVAGQLPRLSASGSGGLSPFYYDSSLSDSSLVPTMKDRQLDTYSSAASVFTTTAAFAQRRQHQASRSNSKGDARF